MKMFRCFRWFLIIQDSQDSRDTDSEDDNESMDSHVEERRRLRTFRTQTQHLYFSDCFILFFFMIFKLANGVGQEAVNK